MQIEVTLRIVGDDDETLTGPAVVLAADKRHDQLAAIGLSLEEGKELLASVQQRIVAAQAEAYVAEQCHCGQAFLHKSRTTLTFRTPFGKVPIDSPRLYRCHCAAAMADAGPQTLSPLTALRTHHTAPELLYLENRWASLMAYGMTVDPLKDVLPVDAGLNPNTVRNHAHRIAEHAEAEFGDERTTLIDGCPRDWEALLPPEGETVVGIDNGYVRDWTDKKTHFGVVVGKSLPRDRPDRYFGLVSSVGSGSFCMPKACR